MKSSAKKIELASVDDLFSTEEGRQDAKLEKIQEIPLSELHPFRNHPFKVKDDEAMMETADSIKQYGVLVPAIARPDPEGGYELVFCFLLAEGFQHTRSKKRYIGLMLAFALISEVPFDIGFFSAYSRMEDTFPFYLKYQNVFFTLFLGLLTLVCLERFSCKSDLPVDRIKSAVLQVLSVVLFSGIAEGIHCDYGMQGILFISAFYICRNHRIYQVLLFLLAYMGTTGNQPPLCTLLACLLILLYNGKRGKLKLKYFFYVFYPAHILVLYLIQIGLGKYLLK